MKRFLLTPIFKTFKRRTFFSSLEQNNCPVYDAEEIKKQEQKEAIESMQQDFEMQTRGLVELQSRNQEIQQEMNRYLDIFKRHNLSKLAAAKPGLIEKRVNNGTKEVFDGIEQDSRIIDSLDDGLQLQSNP